MPITTAVFAVSFTQFNMPVGEPPIHAFTYFPSRMQTLTAAPSGTTYQVAIHLTSNIPHAKIVDFNSLSGEPQSLLVTGTDSDVVMISFTNTGITAIQEFNFSLTVRALGEDFTSDDPEIEIPPPT